METTVPATERAVLDAIHDIIAKGKVHVSRERGKAFFKSGELPARLAEYLAQARLTKAEASRRLDVSSASLSSILAGKDISENMLFRLRNYMEYASQHPGITVGRSENVYPGDWRLTTKEETQDAISTVSKNLIALRDAIKASNSLKGPNAPIDSLQVAQLIALLEATLAAIKGPYIDAQQTGGFFKWLARLGKLAARRGVDVVVERAIDHAVDAGGHLIETLASSSGPSDLGGIAT